MRLSLAPQTILDMHFTVFYQDAFPSYAPPHAPLRAWAFIGTTREAWSQTQRTLMTQHTTSAETFCKGLTLAITAMFWSPRFGMTSLELAFYMLNALLRSHVVPHDGEYRRKGLRLDYIRSSRWRI